MPKKIKYVITVLAVFGALSGVYYGFVNPFEMGVMTSLGIPDFNITSISRTDILLSLAFMCFLFILLFVFLNKVKKIILIVILFSNILLIMQIIFLGFSPKTINIMAYDRNKSFDVLKFDENKLSKAYSFSKKSNVIVIMMDTFQGNIFFDILQKYPKLKEQLSGFTYYKNTLSVGSDTSKSMPAIMGGKSYIYLKKPNYKNAILDIMNIAKIYNYSYVKYPYDEICNFKLFNTDIACIDANEVKIEKEVLKNIKTKIENNRNKLISNFLDTSIIFIKTSFMLSVPHSIRVPIYIRMDTGSTPMASYIYNLSQYHQLKNLSSLANAKSSKKTFKFIHNNLTHNLWMINNKCQVVDKKFSNYEGFFNSAYCSTKLLVDFFNKLKKLEVYDKTKIIITSDHGAHNHKPIKSKFIPVTKRMASALMLVKDFDAKGNISISNKFLSNMDTYGIALSGVSNNAETKLDPIKNYQKDRQLIFVEEVDSKYNAKKVFKVKNNIFNKNNWKELSKKNILDIAQTY